MSKNIKIFVVSGMYMSFDEKHKVLNDLISEIGYFTNLKEVYSKFEKDTIQAYSTICSHIQKNGYYVSKSARFLSRRGYEDFREILIREVETNSFYRTHKMVSLSQMLAKEASLDMHLGMNISETRTFY